jgi:hypothetical protein
MVYGAVLDTYRRDQGENVAAGLAVVYCPLELYLGSKTDYEIYHDLS